MTLCNPMDCILPGSSVHGIFQARVLEWVAISLSNAWKWKVKVKSLSRVRLLATPWTAAYQAPPTMGFSRQEYWSGVPLPSPKDDLDNVLKIGHLNKKKKSGHHFAYKGPYSQSYSFSSSHVQMWQLDHKEGWAQKNWCFRTVVLKTLESPLDVTSNQSILREINPEYSLGDWCWNSNTLATWCKEPTYWKRP